MRTLSRLLFIVPFLIASTVVADPPARVVRLNLTEGEVSFRPAGIDDWIAATVNRPLIDGDEARRRGGSDDVGVGVRRTRRRSGDRPRRRAELRHRPGPVIRPVR